MGAALYLITGRQKEHPFLPSGLSDFSLVPAGLVPVADLAANPDWTLYAVDVARREVMLVEMPAGSDLSSVPFVFGAQYQHGTRAAVVGFDALVAGSASIVPPSQLSFLFSTGRCGSTLASRIFAELPGVWSLSEPDFLSNIAIQHQLADRATLVALVRAATLWMCRPPDDRTVDAVILKPRSEATLIAELCQEAFPQSRNVFMYRDLVGYANSLAKFEQRIMPPELARSDEELWRRTWDFLMVGTPISVLEDYFPADHGAIVQTEFHTLMWSLRIDGYLRALRRGMAFTAIHYADLNSDRSAETARLLRGCGLPEDHMAMALRAFEQDSHTGSITANETGVLPLPPERRARATRLLARMGRRDYVTDRLPE
jgi:hypothetical protein